ncbi:S8 family serine peptidase [Thioalkalivibrio sp. XN279]|uniref:S8 family serine peptidase n=1 Tax=Thioalkalivibrio sp. XN279 TaxID=2714953 RepID=UPI001407ABD4|nr:S8 family serine peptidase [Thioalkalivibrio sp. XN279]NHA13886.1 S8 family serine peptidase [Thioalkalivibrio sp. XN279]
MSLTRYRALSPRDIVAPMVVMLAAALFLFAGLALAAPGPDQDRFIVKFKEGKGPQGKAALRGAGAELLVDLADYDAAAFRIPGQALAGIARNPNVEYIEVDPPRYPMGETLPYGIPMVQADPASGGEAPGANPVKVCVIDSGYDFGHEDLPTNAVSGFASSGQRWDTDTCGHGTHVAGTIAARGGNGAGVVGVLGSNASLVIGKVFDGATCAYSYASSVASAANACAQAGAKVINMSLGCTGRRCASATEENIFNNLAGQGVLSIAAAGNDGTTQLSYPASYPSVVSVAAVDENSLVASFSQQNSQVELSGPGVSVVSTVPRGMGFVASFSVGGTAYLGAGMDGSPTGTVADKPVVNCGLGTATCSATGGAICLIERGGISFADKVLACQDGGGSAAVIYNNEPGLFSGTLGTTPTGIPSLSISQADGQAALTGLSSATRGGVELGAGDYDIYNGTSMATPHVAGVAALVWSRVPGATAAQVREALQATAIDLGPSGRDNAYGFGLVQAADAIAYLGDSSGGGGGGGTDPNFPPTASFTSNCTDLGCSFDGRVSSDSDGTISSYAWTFGDGASASGATTSHTYAAAGTYTVTLTVTDNGGASHSASQQVTVSAPNTGGGGKGGGGGGGGKGGGKK